MSMIELDQIVKDYVGRDGSVTHAVEEITLSLDDGEFVCVVGPSGCGKSTLLKIAGGLIPATSGTAKIAGLPVTRPRGDVGIVFQQPLLLPWRTVLENVLLPVEIQKLDRQTYLEAAKHLLALVELDKFTNAYPNELSGGMQQRVGICRALVNNPKLLLMDEPFGALDAMTREFMNLELLRIWSQSRKTVMFITHSIAEAVFLSDRVVVMSPRPGAVRDVIEVDLPRPRKPGMMSSERFGVLTNRIREHFHLTGAEL
jgi:NitT/TauT family transport system ATP-binding protein